MLEFREMATAIWLNLVIIPLPTSTDRFNGENGHYFLVNTKVGDSSTGYGFDDGKFAFTSTFH